MEDGELENIDLDKSPEKALAVGPPLFTGGLQAGTLAPGRVRMEGNSSCFRFMTLDFQDASNARGTLSSYDAPGCGWYTAVLELPAGVRNVQVRFNVFGGASVCQVDRFASNEWVYDGGDKLQEVFDFATGDGVNAVFRIAGTSLRSYVSHAYDFGRLPGIDPRSWEWWGADDQQVLVDGKAYNTARRASLAALTPAVLPRAASAAVPWNGRGGNAQSGPFLEGSTPGRLRMEGNTSCFRYMSADFKDVSGACQTLCTYDMEGCGWYSCDVEIPPGARDVRVRFNVFGGAKVFKVYRQKSNQWAHEGGEYPQEVFDFEAGDEVNAVFRVVGTSLHSYVSQAFDFGRPKGAPPRPWEWWSANDEDTEADAALYKSAGSGPAPSAVASPFLCLLGGLRRSRAPAVEG